MRHQGELIAGRYRIAAAIGRGGMGEVYRAADEVLGRDVAVKLVLPAPGPLTEAKRFLREARATARVCDPQVITAYDYGHDGDWLYLAMELVSGRTVGDELARSGLFPADRAEHVIRQAAAGLAAAHRLDVVHRDIKPGNLLMADDGSVKVADFGIVRFLDEVPTALTSTRQIVGTALYLAPECALGEPAEPASDVYALGCVLYLLATGRPPFPGDEPTAIMHQHVEREPVPPRVLRPELPESLEALILWMLAKDPADRPSAAEVAAGARPEPATTLLPVRRTPAVPVFAAAAATVAVVLSIAVGILLATRSLDLPTTFDLAPISTPPVVTHRTAPTTPSTPEQRVAPTTAPAEPTRTYAKLGPSSRPTQRERPAHGHNPQAQQHGGKGNHGRGGD